MTEQCGATWADHGKQVVYVCEDEKGHRENHGATSPLDGSWVEIERDLEEILGWVPLFYSVSGLVWQNPDGSRAMRPPDADELVAYLNENFKGDWYIGIDDGRVFGGLGWYTPMMAPPEDGWWEVDISKEQSLLNALATMARKGQKLL